MEREVRWSAPEYHYYEKGLGWYWLVIGIAAAIALVAFFRGNFLFGVFALVAGALMAAWGARHPRTIEIVLTDTGLALGHRERYAIGDLTGFAVAPVPGEDAISELLLRTKRRLTSALTIIVATDRVPAVRDILAERVPEFEHKPSLGDAIARLLRF